MTEEEAYRKMISTIIGCYNTTRPAHVSAVDHVASKSVVRADAELYAISRYGNKGALTDQIDRAAAIEALLDQRQRAAGTFTPEFSGVRGEAYERATLDAIAALKALPPALSVIGEVDHG